MSETIIKLKEALELKKSSIGFSYTLSVEDIEKVIKEYEELQQENKHLNLQLDQALKDYEDLLIKIDKAIENCKKSIESINQKLQDDKTIKVVDGKVVNMNDYQIVRLKAFRTKCKELLEILGGTNE